MEFWDMNHDDIQYLNNWLSLLNATNDGLYIGDIPLDQYNVTYYRGGIYTYR